MHIVCLCICFIWICPLQAFVQIRSLTCKPDDDVCLRNNCSLTTIRKKLSLFNFYCFFEQPQSNIWVHMKFFKKQHQTLKPFVIDLREDFCRIIEKTSYSQIFLRLMPKIRKFSNFSAGCPIQGNISISEFPVSLEFIPATFPQGQYLLKIAVKDHMKNLTIVDVNMGFDVRSPKNG